MYHSHSTNTLSLRISSTLIAASCVTATPFSVAYAVPVDTAVAVSDVPWIPFCAGCAVGAVVGGLTMGLVGKHAKRQLERELEEVLATAERAEQSARRAEAQLRKQTANVERKQKRHQETFGTQSTGKLNRAEVQQKESRIQAADSTLATAEPARSQSSKDTFSTTTLVGHHEEPTQARSKARSKNEKETTGRLRMRLQDRWSTGSLAQVPVIDRGEERERGEEPPLRSRQRTFDPAARAEIINRRLPRFDESLYPDVQSEQSAEADDFEIAMKAMDDSLSATIVVEQSAEASSITVEENAGQHPDIADTESYVEYLIQDEMERNRSGTARRYSRAHLTMFEGTGDLRAARKALQQQQASQYKPRHMQAASSEAQVL